MTIPQTEFRIKNVSRTFVTVQLARRSVDIRVGETIGPFDRTEMTESLHRLARVGAIVIMESAQSALKPTARISKSKTEPEDTGHGK